MMKVIEIAHTIAKHVTIAVQRSLKEVEARSDLRGFVATAGASGALIIAAMFLGREADDPSSNEHAEVKARLTPESMLFAGILAAKTVSVGRTITPTKERLKKEIPAEVLEVMGTEGLVGLESKLVGGAEPLIETLEAWKTITGADPRKYLNHSMLDAIEEYLSSVANSANELLSNLSKNRPAN